MTEEWCGPLQWIENSCKRCCRKNVDFGDSSDSEDEHGDVTPLFSVEDEWCNDGGEEEDGDPEKEEEEVKENDEGSFVQETIGVFDESQNNDCMKNGEEVQNFNEVMGKGNEVSGVVENMEEAREQLEREIVELPHVSIIGGGGAQSKNKTCVNVENGEGNHVEDGNSKEGGCEDQWGENVGEGGEVNITGGCSEQVSLIKKKKKRRQFIGPLKKRREKKKKKEEIAAHNLNIPEKQNSPSPSAEHPSHSSLPWLEGVTRNSPTMFKPSSSMSSSNREEGSISHVESIGDSGIVMGNNRFGRNLEKSKAGKLWRLAKGKLGVSADDENDELYIEKITAMEERDKVAKGKKEKTQGSK